MDGKNYDNSIPHYYTKVKSNMTGMSEKVEVALFNLGEYTFVVESREYDHFAMDVTIEFGMVYQLGANEDGPYFVVDSDGARYQMSEF